MNEQNWTGFLVKLGRQDPCQQVKHTKLLFWPTPNTTNMTPYFHSSGQFDLLQTPQRGTPYFHSSGQFDLLQTPQRGLLISTALDCLTYSKHHKEELLISTALDSLTYSRHHKEDSLFPQLWTICRQTFISSSPETHQLGHTQSQDSWH